MSHPDGIPETSEVCYLTGAPAYARFEGGFGQAWYGSRFDADQMHDRKGDLSGFVSDEVIAGRIDAGLLVVFDNGLSAMGDVDLPEDTAIALFRRGFDAQRMALTSEMGEPRSVFVGRHGFEIGSDGNQVLSPPLFLRRSAPSAGDAGSARDMEVFGARFALVSLARGEAVTEEAVEAAALETHAHVRSIMSAMRDRREMFRMIDGDEHSRQVGAVAAGDPPGGHMPANRGKSD